MKKSIVVLLVFFLITVMVYGQLCLYEFSLWDDNEWIYGNPDLRAPTLSTILKFWYTPFQGLYVPVTFSAWGGLSALSRALFPNQAGAGLNPLLFHGASLLVHLLSICIVFRILKILFASTPAALCGAFLFCLHPLQVEPVAWSSGLKDLLGGLFSFIALWQFLRYAIAVLEISPSPMTADKRDGWRLSFIFANLAYLIAILSKPNAVVTPILALLLLFLVLKLFSSSSLAGGLESRKGSVFKVCLLPIAWIVVALPFIFINKVSQDAYRGFLSPLWSRPFIAGDAVGFYFWKLFLPFRLAIDYGRTPEWVLESGLFWKVGLIPYAAGAMLLWLGRKKHLPLIVGSALFIAGILPVSGLLTFIFQGYSTVADHYLYLSFLGPAVALAWLFLSVRRRMLQAFLFLVLLLLGFLSALQCRTWENSAALFANAVQVNPKSWAGYNNLGMVYSSRGDKEEAIKAFRKSIKINPEYDKAYNNLGIAYYRKGLLSQAGQKFKRAVELSPDYGEAYGNIGLVYIEQNALKRAEKAFKRALALNSGDSRARFNLGLAYFKGGRMQDAIEVWERIPRGNSAYRKAQQQIVRAKRGLKNKQGQ